MSTDRFNKWVGTVVFSFASVIGSCGCGTVLPVLPGDDLARAYPACLAVGYTPNYIETLIGILEGDKQLGFPRGLATLYGMQGCDEGCAEKGSGIPNCPSQCYTCLQGLVEHVYGSSEP